MNHDIAIVLIDIVNFVAAILFLGLLGAVLFSMARRLRLYKQAELPVPVILKRGFVLFAALALLGFETLLIRAIGIDLANNSVLRLAFIVQSDIIMIGAFAYYAKVELFDIDDPNEP
jgi:hypothetical protein